MADRPARPYAFTAEFELAVLRGAVADPALLARLVGFLKPERFKTEEVRLLMTEAVEGYRTGGAPPTRPVIVQGLRRQVEAGKLTVEKLSACTLALEQADALPPVDNVFVVDAVAAEERRRGIWEALDEGLRAVGRGDYDEVVRLIDEAGRIGKADSSPGVDYGRSLQLRTDNRRTGKEAARWGTGIVDLDDAIRGGLAQGELGCFMGAPKSGKSMVLMAVTHHALALGGTVVYYTLEMGEDDLVDRLDASISRVPIRDLRRKAEVVQTCVSDFLIDSGGSLIVKQFPPGRQVGELEAHLRTLRGEQGIEPSIVVVDYGDLLASEGDGRYESLGNVYTELRKLAVDWKVPLWTASQARREALQKKIVTSADIADSWKKVMIADLIVAICGTEEERQAGVTRFSVAACRFAATGSQVGPLRTAFDVGRMVAENQAESF